MKVTTDAALFGAWVSKQTETRKPGAETVLDIGTGTGLLALMYAQKNPEANIDAIEIDEEAAAQALENVEAFPKKNRIQVINADARVFSFHRKYDLIITNPPFYENELQSDTVKTNIARHGKELSIKKMLNIIKDNLKPEGFFCLLLPFKRNAEIRGLLSEHGFTVPQMTFVRQSVKHDYFRIMLTGELRTEKKEQTRFDEISIWNERQQYTPEFEEFLKDFYLHL